MENLLRRNLAEITQLCLQHKVRRLAAFGSVVRGDFDPSASDLDFLVEFEPIPVAERIRQYLALRESLAALFSVPVDLVEDGAIRNPYILRNISEQQQVLYAA